MESESIMSEVRSATHVKCPACGGELHTELVDVGVGNIERPPYCLDCGWATPPGPLLEELTGTDADYGGDGLGIDRTNL